MQQREIIRRTAKAKDEETIQTPNCQYLTNASNGFLPISYKKPNSRLIFHLLGVILNKEPQAADPFAKLPQL